MSRAAACSYAGWAKTQVMQPPGTPLRTVLDNEFQVMCCCHTSSIRVVPPRWLLLWPPPLLLLLLF